MSKLRGPGILTLKTHSAELSMPLSQAVWQAWCILTYPMQLWVGWYLMDWNPGVLFVIAMIVLNHRGKL